MWLMVNISVRMPDDIHAEIQEAAGADLRSVNSEIVYLVSLGLAHRKDEQ